MNVQHIYIYILLCYFYSLVAQSRYVWCSFCISASDGQWHWHLLPLVYEGRCSKQRTWPVTLTVLLSFVHRIWRSIILLKTINADSYGECVRRECISWMGLCNGICCVRATHRMGTTRKKKEMLLPIVSVTVLHSVCQEKKTKKKNIMLDILMGIGPLIGTMRNEKGSSGTFNLMRSCVVCGFYLLSLCFFLALALARYLPLLIWRSPLFLYMFTGRTFRAKTKWIGFVFSVFQLFKKFEN